MTPDALIKSISFELKETAFLRFDKQEYYNNIISPFTRIYLITKGKGRLIVNNIEMIFEAGYLYTIPAYFPCTYEFEADLEQYYIHLYITVQNGLSVYSLINTIYKIKATRIDSILFRQLLIINPNCEIPHHNPKIYQQKPWIQKKVNFKSYQQSLETNGILSQIFSRFVDNQTRMNTNKILNHKIQPVLVYIQNHLNETITITELAEIACISKDHFSKVFKSATGIPPCEFIINKRIENAQFLLLSSNLSTNQIIEKTGFKSATYFCRIFKKTTSFTPEEYRKRSATFVPNRQARQ